MRFVTATKHTGKKKFTFEAHQKSKLGIKIGQIMYGFLHLTTRKVISLNFS